MSAAPEPEGGRPSDELIVAYEQRIKEEQASTHPLVAELETSLQSLAEEYAGAVQGFQQKIEVVYFTIYKLYVIYSF
jgi:hypothetical protein